MLQSKRFVHKIFLGNDFGEKRKLGFTIVGGSDSLKGAMGIYVRNVSEDGLAHGRLHGGDELISINGTNLQNMKHREALLTIKNCRFNFPIVFLIGRRRYVLGKQMSLPSSTFDPFSTIPEEHSATEQSGDDGGDGDDRNGDDDDDDNHEDEDGDKISKSERHDDDSNRKNEDIGTSSLSESLKMNLESGTNCVAREERSAVHLLGENNLKIVNQTSDENSLKTENEINSRHDRSEISNEGEHDKTDEGIGSSGDHSRLEIIESFDSSNHSVTEPFDTSNSDVFDDSFDSSAGNKLDRSSCEKLTEENSKASTDGDVLNPREADCVFSSEINDGGSSNRSRSQVNEISGGRNHFVSLKMGHHDNQTILAHYKPTVERYFQKYCHDDEDDDDNYIGAVKVLHFSETFVFPTIKRRQINSINYDHSQHRLDKPISHNFIDNKIRMDNFKSNEYSRPRDYKANNETFEWGTGVKNGYHRNVNKANDVTITKKFKGLLASNTKPIIFESKKLSKRDQLIDKYKHKHESDLGLANPLHARLSKSSTSLHKQCDLLLW